MLQQKTFQFLMGIGIVVSAICMLGMPDTNSVIRSGALFLGLCMISMTEEIVTALKKPEM